MREMKVKNLFRELSMMNVEGYEKLTDEQKDLFDQTYKSHVAMMGADMRKKHTEEHIEKVEWDKSAKCLKVHFDNGDWYHYQGGDWY